MTLARLCIASAICVVRSRVNHSFQRCGVNARIELTVFNSVKTGDVTNELHELGYRSGDCEVQLFTLKRFVGLQPHATKERALGNPPGLGSADRKYPSKQQMFRKILSRTGTRTMSFAEAEWTIALDINIESSMLYDILYPLSMALVFSFVRQGKFLLVRASFPYLSETFCDVCFLSERQFTFIQKGGDLWAQPPSKARARHFVHPRQVGTFPKG